MYQNAGFMSNKEGAKMKGHSWVNGSVPRNGNSDSEIQLRVGIMYMYAVTDFIQSLTWNVHLNSPVQCVIAFKVQPVCSHLSLQYNQQCSW